MPIAVACTCGVKLKAPDAAAGKRVKCPKCGSGLLVPVPAPEPDFEFVDDEPAPPPVAAVAKPVAKPKPMLIEDDEDEPRPAKKKPRVIDDEEDAKPAKKKAAKPVEVDEPVDDEDEKPKKKSRRDRDEEQEAPKKKSRRDPDDEDEKPAKKSRRSRDDDEDEDAPKKTGKKSALPLILGIGGGAVVLAVVGIIVGVVMMNGNTDQTKGTNTSDGTKPTFPKVETPPVVLPDGWKKFQGEGFSVGVPNYTEMVEQSTEFNPRSPDGTVTKVWYQKNSTKDGQLVYTITRMALSKQQVAQFEAKQSESWAGIVQGIERSTKTKAPLSVSVVKAGDLFGRQLVGADEQKEFVVQLYIDKGHIHTLKVVKLKGLDPNDPLAKTFFESFRTDDTGPPEGGTPPKPFPEPIQLPPAEIPTGWKKYQGEGFSVGVRNEAEFPKEVDTEFTRIPPLTSARRWSFTLVKDKEFTLMLVEKLGVDAWVVTDYRKDPSATLDMLAKGTNGVGGDKSAVVSTVTVGGIEGREVVKDSVGNKVIRRFVMKDGFLYNVTVAGPAMSADDPRVKPFFDSFRFEK